MNLKAIAEKISLDPRLDDIISSKKSSLEGLLGGSRAAFYSALFLRTGKQILIISQDPEELAENISAYLGPEKAFHFPSWDTYPTEDISPSKEIIGERLAILDSLLKNQKMIVAISVRSAATRTIPKKALLKNELTLEVGGSLKRDALPEKLVKLGFKRRDIVGERGEFSVRGGIVDIFTPNLENPIRLEYLGDKIESMRFFDAVNQRSVKNITKASIFPLHEIILEDGSEYSDGIEARIPEFYGDFTGILDYFSDSAIVIMDNKDTLKLSFEKFVRETEELRQDKKGKFCIEFTELQQILSSMQVFEHSEGSGSASMGFGKAPDFYGKLDGLVDWLAAAKDEQPVFMASKQADRLYDLFQEKGLAAVKTETAPMNAPKGLYVLRGRISEGYSGNGMTVLSDKEMFAELPSKVRFAPKPSEGVSGALLAELNHGDYVVHTNYGIGIFRGLQKLVIGGALQEYIQIDYAQDDKLYVPLSQMGMVEKYSGGGDYKPKIGRLGNAEWARVKARAKRSIKDITEELLDLYVSRQREEGFRYPSDSAWDVEFERSFAYEETGDQIKAINDIKKEMEDGKLIDRLVCGDVGYGKTEVALRAAFKTALAGQQVAVLTPTTVLADQHFRTFSQRFKPYPLTVDVLSRFRTKEEQKSVIKSLEAGAVDIVIGTHRLLQKDIKFKNLGLLIVDEEQKFGVTHKERLKQIAKGVNVITLTATPIPRTLYMALSGVRELSVISTPPVDRSPVRTYLREWDENIIKEAIRRELERGGQVFFVHNYVRSIDKVAALVRSIVPEARMAVAHGQMKEDQLEDIMIKFLNREFDVLVSTSIIESGLDIPSVNTVIIDHAEDFGLSQLYQIRGRVGRSSTRAFAYLLYHKETVLTDKALERLKAIQEFTALGSGYKLAMADLEIRGAGNILGAQQHGHMLSIGFDMYCDLLEESVRELKHIDTPPAKRISIDLKIDAFIPPDYVPDDKQRIALYRRMNFINDGKELDDIRKELEDRFGSVPAELESLFRMIRLKIAAGEKGVTSLIGGSESVEIKFELKKSIIVKTKGMAQQKWFKMLEDTVRKLPAK